MKVDVADKNGKRLQKAIRLSARDAEFCSNV